MQLYNADPQIGLVELVRNVPPQRTEIAPLLYQRVEKAQAEEQLFEINRLIAGLEELRVADRIAQVRTHDVRAKTLRGFVGHLHAVLQDGNRKVFGRIRRQPQPEVRMGGVRRQALTDSLQGRHEALRQVAVLQNDPGAVPDALVYQLHGDRPLALSQGQREESGRSETLIVGEFKEDGGRIGARGQDEDKRDAAVRVGERGGQVEGRRFDVLPAEVFRDEHLYCGNDLVHSQASQHQGFLETGEFGVPVSRKRVSLRFGGIKYLLPVFHVLIKVIFNTSDQND